MADEVFDSILSKATGGESDKISDTSVFDSILQKAGGSPGAQAPVSPLEQPKQVSEIPSIPETPDTLDSILAKTPGTRGLGETFTRGLARGWGQAKAVIPSLQAMHKEYTGDLPGAIDLAQKTKVELDTYGDSDWNLQNIKDPIDFGYWMTEKLGEQGVNLLTMIGTGGVGGLAAKTAATSLLERGLIGQTSARALMLAGSAGTTYPLTTAMETAGTSQEQFETSQAQNKLNPNIPVSTQPGRSLAAGAAKGVLELLTPLDIGRAMLLPGRQLGRSTLAGITRVTAEEGLTEAAQEAIDIYARKLQQPDYSYFKNGPTLWPSGYGEGMWRLLESGAAGAAVGGVVGAPFAHHEQVSEKRAAVEKGKGLGFSFEGSEAPGTRTVIPPEAAPPIDTIPHTGGNPEGLASVGPVTALRQMSLGKSQAQDKVLSDSISNDPKADFLSLGPLLADLKLGEAQQEKYLDLLDANTPRFMEMAVSPLQAAIRHKGEVFTGNMHVDAYDKAVAKNGNLSFKPSETEEGFTTQNGTFLDRKQAQNELMRLEPNYRPMTTIDGLFAEELAQLPPRLQSRLFTDTEIEREVALKRPQNQKQTWLRVDQSKLQPGAITAHMEDLPEIGSDRIFFLPGTTPGHQALAMQYYPQALLKVPAAYDIAVTNGMRVIPSRGAGFHYNGMIDFKGLPIEDVKQTKRSTEVGWYDPVSRTVSTFSDNEEEIERNRSSAGGILVALDRNRLSKDDYVEHENGDIELKKNLEAMTYGIMPASAGMLRMQTQGTKFLQKDKSESFTTLDPNGMDPNAKTAHQLKAEVDKLLPAVDKILQRLGIEGKINVEITSADDVSRSGPLMWADLGWIQLPADPTWVNAFKNAEIAAHDWIMHEVGHFVTYHYFKNLPTEIQQSLLYAQEKGALANQMGNSSKVGSVFSDNPTNRAYWSTLPEWLAEQFRRWTISDAIPKTEIEKTFKAGSRKQEAFFKEWEKTAGRNAVMDLTQPDHATSAVYNYLQETYVPTRDAVRQAIKRNNIQLSPADLLDSPFLTSIANTVVSAVESMSALIPQDVQIQLKERLSGGINANLVISSAKAAYNKPKDKNLGFIEIALAALPSEEENLSSTVRGTLIHELVHAYEDKGFFTLKELQLLTKEATANSGKLIPPQILQRYAQTYAKDFQKQGITDPAELDAHVTHALQMELRAYYVQSFANSGLAFGTESQTILARLMAIVERIKNALMGLGYQTKEDILRALFKGEMVHRADRIAEEAATQDWIAGVDRQASVQLKEEDFKPNAVWTHENGLRVEAYYDTSTTKQEARAIIYHWMDPQSGEKKGDLLLVRRGPKGFNIEGAQTWGAGKYINFKKQDTLESTMVLEAEKDLGMKFRLAGEFSSAGFKMARLGEKAGKIEKGLLDLYMPIKMEEAHHQGGTLWISPIQLRAKVAYWSNKVAETIDGPVGRITHEMAVGQYKAWRSYFRKLPKDIWADPRLEKMFNLKRNWERDEVQGSLLRSGQRADEGKLMSSLGFPQPAQSEAFGDNLALKQQLSQGENARNSGLPYNLSAPSSMYSFHLGKTWSWASGMESAPWVQKDLKNLKHEVDRIGRFMKNWISIKQLAQSNEHIMPLQNYVTHQELMGLVGSKWHQIAKETIHLWDNGRNPEAQKSIADTFFALTEMKYRTPAEEAAGIQRLPGAPGEWQTFLQGGIPGAELGALFRANNLKAKDWEVIRKVSNDFQAFLGEAQASMAAKLTQKLSASPATLQTALAKLASDMSKFQTKPYFPMMRFGQYTASVRVGGKLVETQSFGSQRERDAARHALRAKYPGGELTFGSVPEHSIEFMGLPAPLLSQIKDNLLDTSAPGLTAEQIALMNKQKEWIAEFELLHDPDRTFRKRWLPAKGVPGYSLDAKRVYAHYFNSGARYLSRLMYLEDLRKDVKELRDLAETRGDQTKITKIGDYVEAHLNYTMEGGRDGGKFRAFVALWFLGFSPVAAFMNYTQPVLNGIPKLGADFNSAKAMAAWLKSNGSLAKNMGYATGNPMFEKARTEMIRQEYITVGQAAELASFAEANNLSKLRLGTKAQQFYRKLGSLGMAMFSHTEHYAREVMMHTAWHLAMQNPGAARLAQLDVIRLEEISDLQTRLGMSHQEALAFVYAKEAIDRTQFAYNRLSDPPAMRGAGKNFLIFFKFTQSTLFAFGHNGAFVQMMLMYLFFFGISGGIPGGEDANEFIRMLSKIAVKLGFASGELDLQDHARAAIRGLTKGTIFDEVGPDLAMHGISRYGFGMGLMPTGWATPRVDLSANGSVGKVIPGFADMMHGMNNGKDVSKSIADGVERASGAGYGTVFAMLHALMDPGSADSKKWTAFVPRAFKAEYNAYRYGALNMIEGQTGLPVSIGNPPMAATNQAGAKIPGTKFDPTDWMDIATVLGQALGATPTKVNQQWEAIRATTDVENTFKMRRSALMVDLDKALLEKNQAAQDDVMRKIMKYDQEVSESFPEFAIKANQLLSSLKQHQQRRGMMETTGAQTKPGVLTSQKVLENYPGAKAERVR